MQTRVSVQTSARLHLGFFDLNGVLGRRFGRFGMGIDRSDVRCVIPAAMPKSIEHYQQETGRAGRDGLEAECVLLYSAADVVRWHSLIKKGAAIMDSAPEFVNASLALTEAMRRFCVGLHCRHRRLAEYFGQSYDKASCEACDVCLNEVEGVSDGAGRTSVPPSRSPARSCGGRG